MDKMNEQDALEALYRDLGLLPEEYITSTLFSVIDESREKGERFSISDIVTKDDIKTLLAAALVLKKVSFVNETFYSPKGQPVTQDRKKSTEIANELHLAADNIQQFALITAVAKGLSQLRTGSVSIVSMQRPDEEAPDDDRIMFIRFDA